MAVLGGKESPTFEDVKAILAYAEVEVKDEDLKFVLKRLEGKTAHELIAEGQKKFAAAGGGGGGAVAVAAAPAAGGAAPAAGGKGKAEAKKAAAVEEEEEEAVDFDLFG